MASSRIQELLAQLEAINAGLGSGSGGGSAAARRAARQLLEEAEQNPVPELPENLVPPTPFDPPDQRINIGGFPGSGLIENILGTRGVQGTLGNIQKATETLGGAALSIGEGFIPGEQSFERNLRELAEERGGPVVNFNPFNFRDLAHQAQLRAEAFRRTDLPSVRVDVTPFGHIPLPGGHRLDEVDLGVKGAIELVTDPTNLIPGAVFAKAGTKPLSAGARILGKVSRGLAPELTEAVTTGARELAESARNLRPSRLAENLPGDAAEDAVLAVPSRGAALIRPEKTPPGLRQTPRQVLRPTDAGKLRQDWFEFSENLPAVVQRLRDANPGRATKPLVGALGFVLNRVNPSVLLKPADKLGLNRLVYFRQAAEAPSLAEASVLALVEPVPGKQGFARAGGGGFLSPEPDAIFRLDDQGRITNLATDAPFPNRPASPTWQNVVENAFVEPSGSGFAQRFDGRLITEHTPEEIQALLDSGQVTQAFVEQSLYIKQIQDWFAEIEEMLREYGVDVKSVLLPEGGSYISRVVREINKIAQDARSKRAGTKQPPLRARLLHADQLIEGIEHGISYETNPVASFMESLEAAYQAVRDTQLKNALEPEAVLRKDEFLEPLVRLNAVAQKELDRAESAVDLLKRAQRGESLPGSSRGLIKSLGPDIGASLNEAFSYTGQRRRAALNSARDIARDLLVEARQVRKEVRDVTSTDLSQILVRLGIGPGPIGEDFASKYPFLTEELRKLQNADNQIKRSTGRVVEREIRNIPPVGSRTKVAGKITKVEGPAENLQTRVLRSVHGRDEAALKLFTRERKRLTQAINKDVTQITEVAKRTDTISKIAGRTEGRLLGKEREFLSKYSPELLERVDEAMAADDIAKRKALFGDLQKAVEQLVEDKKILRDSAKEHLSLKRKQLENVRIETKGRNKLTNRHDVEKILLAGRESSTGQDLIIRESSELPFLTGLYFTEDELKRIESILPPGVKNHQSIAETFFLQTVPGVADITRILKAGFDFGAPFLQGIPVLARRPDIWAKAVARHFKVAALGGHYHTHYLTQNIDVVREMVQRGIPVSGAATDYFLAIQKGGALIKGGRFAERQIARLSRENPAVLSAARATGRFGENIALRFENSFEAFGDYVRIEMYKALRETALKEGPQGLDELAAFIRNSTGALHTGSLGVGPSQQALERGWLFFSPRYTRASLALIADAFQGGLRGRQARQTLGAMIAGGAAGYWAFATALGQPVKLDPRPKSQGGDGAEFMTVEIAGQNVGIGSFWTSFARLMGSTVGSALDEPETLASVSTRDNPIVRWFRSRSAPTTGFLADWINGANFLGEPLDSLTDWTKHITRQTLPFAIENAVFEDGGLSGRAFGFGTETAGGRNFPVSAIELRDREREVAARERFNKTWDELNGLQKKSLENDPNRELGRLSQEVINQARRFNPADPDGLDAKVTEFFRLRDKAESEWRTEIKTGLELFAARTIDSVIFKERYLAPANTARSIRLEDLNADERFQEVKRFFAENRDNKALRPEDLAYIQYIETIVATDEFETPLGFDFRAQDEKERAYAEEWGDEMLVYVKERFKANRETPDFAFPSLIEELYDGREKFRYYWADVEEAVLGQMRDPDSARALYEEWLNSTPTRRDVLTETSPVLKDFISRMGKVRREMRERNPELDAFLYRWGFTDTLAAKENQWDGAELFWRYAPAMSYPLPVQAVR